MSHHDFNNPSDSYVMVSLTSLSVAVALVKPRNEASFHNKNVDGCHPWP